MSATDLSWWFTYPAGVGLAPWEIMWYAGTYLFGIVGLIALGFLESRP